MEHQWGKVGMSYEDMVSADKGATFEQLHLKMALDTRVKCDGWDGNPRKCKSCRRVVETTRLKLLNATQCSICVRQQSMWDDDDEYL